MSVFPRNSILFLFSSVFEAAEPDKHQVCLIYCRRCTPGERTNESLTLCCCISGSITEEVSIVPLCISASFTHIKYLLWSYATWNSPLLCRNNEVIPRLLWSVAVSLPTSLREPLQMHLKAFPRHFLNH